MNLSELEIKYEVGSLDVGQYRIYHTSIDNFNLMNGYQYTETELYYGVVFTSNEFPQSLITIFENEEPIKILVDKVI